MYDTYNTYNTYKYTEWFTEHVHPRFSFNFEFIPILIYEIFKYTNKCRHHTKFSNHWDYLYLMLKKFKIYYFAADASM